MTWTEHMVTLPFQYEPQKVRTDGAQWQVQVCDYIPTPHGALEEYIKDLREACSRLEDPVLDCWVQGTEFDPELGSEVRGWREATPQESNHIEHRLKK